MSGVLDLAHAGVAPMLGTMGRPKDLYVTAALELAFVVERCTQIFLAVGPSPIFDPPFRTQADGTVLVPGEPGGWIPINRGPISASALLLAPYTITDSADPDFGLPAFTALATRSKLAEELLDAIAKNAVLADALERYPGRSLSKEAKRRNLRHARLLDELPAVAEVDDVKRLDNDEVFSHLRESLLARVGAAAGVTPKRTSARALDRLLPGRWRRPRITSERAMWVGQAHAAARVLGLYTAGVDAYDQARRERVRNAP